MNEGALRVITLVLLIANLLLTNCIIVFLMSSHHIIRDDQEPALCLLGVVEEDFDLIRELLAWSPRVVVATQSLTLVKSWEIKIDVLFAPSDSIQMLEKQLAYQTPVNILPMSSSFLEDVFCYAMQNSWAAMNFVVPKVMVKDVLLMAEKHADALSIVLFGGGFKVFRVKNGVFKKWVIKGTCFSLPLLQHENFDSFSIVGLEYAGQGVWVKNSDGMVEMHAPKEPWLMEESNFASK